MNDPSSGNKKTAKKDLTAVLLLPRIAGNYQSSGIRADEKGTSRRSFFFNLKHAKKTWK
jgi:hypothetical protein